VELKLLIEVFVTDPKAADPWLITAMKLNTQTNRRTVISC
jgi:hypothetical protein